MRFLISIGALLFAAYCNASCPGKAAPNYGVTPKTPVPKNFQSTAQWGGKPFKCGCDQIKPMTAPNRITIHHTVTSGNASPGTIQSLHQDGRGWCDIGYHFMIDIKGNIYQGRAFFDDVPADATSTTGKWPAMSFVSGAHVGGKNTNNIGIVLIGCFDEDKACDAFRTKITTDSPQYKAVVSMVAYLAPRYGVDVTANTVQGHRELGQTKCPGSAVFALVPQIRKDAQAIINQAESAPAPAPTGGTLSSITSLITGVSSGCPGKAAPHYGVTPKTPVPGNFHSTAQWGGKPFKCGCDQIKPMTAPNRITIHHTVTSGDESPGTIQSLHQDGRGWCDIGYHFMIDIKGNIYQGRAFFDDVPAEASSTTGKWPEMGFVSGAHVGGKNTNNIGIVLIGCFDEDKACDRFRTKITTDSPQYKAVVSMVAYLAPRYGVDVTANTVQGHRELGQTKCPGSAVFALVPQIRKDAQEIIDRAEGAPAASGGTLSAITSLLTGGPSSGCPGKAAPHYGVTPKTPVPRNFQSTAQWGGKPFKCGCGQIAPMTKPNRITIHHTVTSGDESPGTIQSLHQDGRGWCDIGYHFMIDIKGNIYQGRAFFDDVPAGVASTKGKWPEMGFVSGAHVGGKNTNNIGIVLIGCFDEDKACDRFRTKITTDSPQYKAVVSMVAYLAPRYGVDVTANTVQGHRELGQTKCPGSAVFALVPQIRKDAQAIINQAESAAAPAGGTLSSFTSLITGGPSSGCPGKAAPHYGVTPKTPVPQNFQSTAQWGGKPFKCGCNQIAPMTKPNRITIHHTVTSGDESPGTIQSLHQDGRGWCDIGYHFMIDIKGNIYQGRAFFDDVPAGVASTTGKWPAMGFVSGAHVGGRNTNNIGIVLIGCFDEDKACDRFRTKITTDSPQYKAVVSMVAYLAPRYGVDVTANTVQGHRELGQTKCPGSAVFALVPQIRKDAQAIIDQAESAPAAAGGGLSAIFGLFG